MTRTIATIAIFATLAAPAFAGDDFKTLPWSEAASLIAGKKASLTTTDGKKISGKVLNADTGGALIRTGRGSKSEQTVSGNQISEVRFGERGHKWQLIGLAAGIGAGGGIGYGAAGGTSGFGDSAAGGLGIATGVAAAGGVAGYFLGRMADHHTVVIRVR